MQRGEQIIKRREREGNVGGREKGRGKKERKPSLPFASPTDRMELRMLVLRESGLRARAFPGG